MGSISRGGVVALTIGLFVLSESKPIHAEVPRPPDSIMQPLASDKGAESTEDVRTVTCGSSTSVSFVTLDLVIMADYSSFYTEAAAYDRALLIFKLVQATYAGTAITKPVSLRLHRIYQSVGTDPFSTSTDPATLLTSIQSWKAANAADSSVSALLAFTSRNMDSSSPGLAYQSALCTSFNVGFVSESVGSNLPYVQTMTAHMLGHLGGMAHDGSGNACSSTAFIMSPLITQASPPSSFSSCSISSWNTYVNSVTCVRQWGPQLGDLNCDCAVNLSDIDPLVLALLDPATYQSTFPSCSLTQCDLNGDGSVDGKDIRCIKSILLQ